MNGLALLIWYASAFAAGWILFRVLRRTLEAAGHVRVNFLGRRIPTSLGAGFAMLAVAETFAAAVYYGENPPAVLSPLLITALGFGLFGMLDDAVVTREPGGFKGHLGRLGAGGGVSTALMKAFFGLGLSLTVSLLYWRAEGTGMVIVNACLVALCANTVNLLDVRPGRAVKGFIFMAAFILAGTAAGMYWGGWAAFSPGTLVLFVPFVLWAVAYSKLDLTCRAMLGDAGSNILGAVAGVLAVHELSTSNRWILLALIAGFHFLCEATSLTRIIDSVGLLKKLDSWGIRPGE